MSKIWHTYPAEIPPDNIYILVKTQDERMIPCIGVISGIDFLCYEIIYWLPHHLVNIKSWVTFEEIAEHLYRLEDLHQ